MKGKNATNNANFRVDSLDDRLMRRDIYTEI